MLPTVFLLLTAFAVQTSTPAVHLPDPVFEVSISGMTCKGCVKEAKGILSKIEHVKNVDIDLKAAKATITMNAGSTLDRATVEKALKDSKFSVTAFAEKAAESKPKH